MIKVKRGYLNTVELKKAFMQIDQEGEVGMDAAWLLDRYINWIDRTNTESAKRSREILDKYVERDEKGGYKQSFTTSTVEGKEVKTPAGFLWKSEADKALAENELEAIAEEELALEVRPMFKHDLSNVRLPASQWRAIRPFIADLDVVEGGKK